MEEKEKLDMPARQITVQIGPNSYDIKFPTNAQLIDIESMKIRMTGGTHKDMLFSNSSMGQMAYLTVEAIATFEVLIGDELKKVLSVKSLLDLNMQESKSLQKAYKKYYDWMAQWQKVLNEDADDDK
jgi:hypothetical protein